MLAIEDGIGKLPYPVAEYHEAGLAREHQVELDVAVAKHEVVDTGIEDYLNPTVVGSLFIATSGALLVLSKKVKALKAELY